MRVSPSLWIVPLLILAGCAAKPLPEAIPAEGLPPAIVPGTLVAPFWDNPIRDGVSHNHDDAAEHADNRNMELVKYLPRNDNKGGGSEIDIIGDYAYQCVSNGFRIIDLTNRADPVEVGLFQGHGCSDVKATHDGQLAVLSGRWLVDVSTKSNPVEVFDYGAGTGCHMCFVHPIGGDEYVFNAQSLGSSARPTLVKYQGVIEVVKIIRGATPAESKMQRVATWIADPLSYPNVHTPDANPYEFSIHDMYVYDDPVLKKPVMVVAHWDMGVRFVDVSTPALPVEFAKWDDFGGDCGDIHTVDVDFIDGKRIVAAATENAIIIDPACSLSRRSIGFVYLIDATDFNNIKTLGKWFNPGAHPSEETPQRAPQLVAIYSQHNIHFVQGKVYSGMYHGGAWVIDAASFVRAGGATPADTLLRKPVVPSVGVYFPTCEGKGPNVWEAFPKDGFLYVSDINCGLFAVHFAGDPKYDPAFTGDA